MDRGVASLGAGRTEKSSESVSGLLDEDARGLSSFSAYAKALELFDRVACDVMDLSGRFELSKLVSQQLASADSIAANIEEGYGRDSRKEYAQFLVIARGSAQETLGRCKRLRHWLPSEVLAKHAALRNEIIPILTKTILTLRSRP